MLCAGEIVAANRRVRGSTQDLGVVGISDGVLYVRGSRHLCTDGINSSVLDLTQPDEVNELEWRKAVTARVIVGFADALSG